MLRSDQQIRCSLLDFVILTVELDDVSELVWSREDVLVDESRTPLLVLSVLGKSQVNDETLSLGFRRLNHHFDDLIDLVQV